MRSHALVEQERPYNPYQPPAALEPTMIVEAPSDLATRGSRVAASFIDALIIGAIALPVQFASGVFDQWPHLDLTLWKQVSWGMFNFLCWVGIHGYSLKTRAQTLGKRLFHIQMVNVGDGLPASFRRLVLWRQLPLSLVALIPRVGVFVLLVDLLLIFAKDRRCLHDHLAGTRVVRLAPRAKVA